jgi:hypothetical protein
MRQYLRFQLERWLQRGVVHQLLFAATLIVSVSILGGLAAWLVTDQFEGPPEGVWWSFLRLSDPGYLGDDEGLTLRAISTVVTVLGYVLFLGSLVAIMTQWLNDTLSRFEQGLSTISMQGHVVILGWTNRTPEIVRQLLAAEGRLRRFLEAHGQRRLRIVVVADEVDAERRVRLRSYLAKQARRPQVFLRRGAATNLADLTRFDLSRAAVAVVPGDEFRYGGADASDARIVQSLMNLRSHLQSTPKRDRPLIVAEVLDVRKEQAAASAYGGPIEVVPGDAVMLAHNEGCSPFVRASPEFVGQHPLALSTVSGKALVIGALRNESGQFAAHLNPPADFRLVDGDRLVFLAPHYDDCVVATRSDLSVDESVARPCQKKDAFRLLVLGWSIHVDQTLEGLVHAGTANLDLTLVSRMPVHRRQVWLKGRELPLDLVGIEHVEADIIASGTMSNLDLGSYDSVLVAASSYSENAEASDARALTGYELLRAELLDQCPDASAQPKVVLEVSHPASSRFVTEPGDVLIVRPRILGFLQSHVALHPELNAVFEALFLPSGTANVVLRGGPDASEAHRYSDLVQSSRARGDIALGVLLDAGTASQQVILCPPEDLEWSGTANLIVLTAESSKS